MRLVTVLFGSPGDFLACYTPEVAAGALFCPTRTPLALGEELLIEVGFPGLPNRTLLRGRAHQPSSMQGAWIRLDPADARARDYLVALARGEQSDDELVARGHLRIPASLPVDCRIDEADEPETERVLSTTQDVGTGGVFIRSTAPPAVGTRVQLVLGPTADAGATFQLEGQVAWLRRDPAARGFGVKFDPQIQGDARRLRAMLRHAWESGRVEFAS
jgi:Tfp pilus assembly protein PilZ